MSYKSYFLQINMAQWAIPIAIIVAAIIIVIGFGFFNSNPKVLATTSTSVSTTVNSSSTTSSTSTIEPSTTTIEYVSISSVINNTYMTAPTQVYGKGTIDLIVHVNGTLAWEAINSKNGYYVVTSNAAAFGNGGYNDSLNTQNNQQYIILDNVSCYADQGSPAAPSLYSFTCSPEKYTGGWSLAFSGRNYTFTGELFYSDVDGNSYYSLNVTNVASHN